MQRKPGAPPPAPVPARSPDSTASKEFIIATNQLRPQGVPLMKLRARFLLPSTAYQRKNETMAHCNGQS